MTGVHHAHARAARSDPVDTNEAGRESINQRARQHSTRQGLSPSCEELNKPPFQPPACVFAPVSTLLYGLIATSAYMKVAHDVDSLAARLFVPYVEWVGFATLLNEEIVRRDLSLPSGQALGLSHDAGCAFVVRGLDQDIEAFSAYA